jgi:hypothetical protein
MRLVPRQLQRHGMTGNVPYYGGRLSPAQAYAASNPTSAAPPPGVPMYSGRMTPGQTLAVSHAPGAPPAATPVPPAATPVPPADRDALRRLAASGVITPAELAAIEGRMA